MTHETKHKLKVALTTALVVGATALAGNVTVPNVFTPNTPARASEVNANFSAVKTAVDDNHARLQSVEGALPSLQSNVTTLQSTVGTLNTTTWKRTGNLGTNPATDYLGTADNTPLDVRVNATSVARFGPGQLAINHTSAPTAVELTVQGTSSSGGYANMYLRQATNSAGYMMSVGDANSAVTPEAWFYIDSYSPGVHQTRRLVITDRGYLGVNRNDTFISGIGNVPLMVGTDGASGNGAYLSSGGSWTNGSSRLFKHAFQAVNTGAILEKVVALPISSWEYTGSSEGRHLGPVAEDFAAAFELGKDPRRIATVDEGGVALAAIQGLNAKLERENAELRKALVALEQRLTKLER